MTDESQSEHAPAEGPLSPPALWYTVENGERAGPWPLSSLHDRARMGLINARTLVWSESMTDWAPYGSRFGLDQGLDRQTRGARTAAVSGARPTPMAGADGHGALVIERSPEAPSPDASEGSAPRSFQQESAREAPHSNTLARDTTPRPWHRWFARIVDVYLAIILAAFVMGAIGGAESVPTNDFAWALIGPALVFLTEPFLLRWFGATPGKGLLNVKVTEPDGTPLSVERSWSRSFQSWTAGLGVGFPLVSLFTLLNQHSELKKNGSTTYDRRLNVRVSHGPVGTLRTLGIIVFLFTLVALMASGSR